MEFHHSFVMLNGPVTISENIGSIIASYSCNVTLDGPIIISMNKNCEYIILLPDSEILFNQRIIFKTNFCDQIIVLKSHQEAAYIKVMEYSNTTFSQNIYTNLIVVDTDNNHYNFYPFCHIAK